jgi:hypothetical protein
MSNVRRLTLSADSYTVPVVDIPKGTMARVLRSGLLVDEEGQVIPQIDKTIKRRETELDMLSTLAEIAANKVAKGLKEANVCLDLQQQLENVTDAEEYVDVAKTDTDLLSKAFAEVKGSRQESWLKHCRDMLHQIEKPADPGEKKEGEESDADDMAEL